VANNADTVMKNRAHGRNNNTLVAINHSQQGTLSPCEAVVVSVSMSDTVLNNITLPSKHNKHNKRTHTITSS
jgi:hypothetical protein